MNTAVNDFIVWSIHIKWSYSKELGYSTDERLIKKLIMVSNSDIELSNRSGNVNTICVAPGMAGCKDCVECDSGSRFDSKLR